jgi:hypothetical protein
VRATAIDTNRDNARSKPAGKIAGLKSRISHEVAEAIWANENAAAAVRASRIFDGAFMPTLEVVRTPFGGAKYYMHLAAGLLQIKSLSQR